ncbi:MAG: hypothetical protein ACKO0Z_18385, partial [Betaproteobacteria bacterium]
HMSFRLAKPILPAFSNMTNEELATHIRNQYPDLQGPLKMLLERFANRARELDFDFQEVKCGHCPYCGVELEEH